MYLEHYGFREKPFSLAADTEYLYLGSQHKDALTLLTYGLSENSGVILMTGDAGTGKTSLIKYVMEKIDSLRTSKVVMVSNPLTMGDDLAEFLIQELKVDTEDAETAPLRHKALETHLYRMRRMRKRVLLAIDEAQCLSDGMLEQIRLLTNLQRNKELLIQVLLVGQNELKVRMQSPRLSSMIQRLSVACNLGPLSLRETAEYVHHRLKVAGLKKPAAIFAKEALKVARKASGGIPRAINQICDTALTYGYAEGVKGVDEALMYEVVKDRKKTGLPLGAACRGVLPATPETDLDSRLQSIEGAVKTLRRAVGV